MPKPTRCYPEPAYLNSVLAAAKYKYFVSSEERGDGGPGYWSVCDRSFAEAATDMLRSAIRACKPVPSILGNQRRSTPAPIAR